MANDTQQITARRMRTVLASICILCGKFADNWPEGSNEPVSDDDMTLYRYLMRAWARIEKEANRRAKRNPRVALAIGRRTQQTEPIRPNTAENNTEQVD